MSWAIVVRGHAHVRVAGARVVLGRVDVHRLLGPAVIALVDLDVSFESETVERDTSRRGLL